MRRPAASREVLRLAASLERSSEHPLARAVREAARQQAQDASDTNGATVALQDVQAVPGRGIEGRLTWQGRDWQLRLGSRAWAIESLGAEAGESTLHDGVPQAAQWAEQGSSVGKGFHGRLETVAAVYGTCDLRPARVGALPGTG